MHGQTYLRLRRRLNEPPELPTWPDGVRLERFTESAASEAHALLALAYADGGGSVPSFGDWWSALTADSEYDSSLCFPVRDGEGTLVAFAQCWTSAFVKDVVVHPDFRRRGIARALLLHVFRVFQERGAQAVELKVEINNPTGAIALYEGLGMVRIAS